MRIIVFTLAYAPFVGGAELAIQEITKRLPDISFDIITANLDGRQSAYEQQGNVTIHRIGRGFWSKYTFPWQASEYALRLHQANPCNMIWAMMANQAGLAAARFKKQAPKIPYVLTLQEGDSLWHVYLRTWWLYRWYQKVYRQADYIQAISRHLEKRALSFGCVGQHGIVPNGVDLAIFQSSSLADRLALRQQLGLSADDKVVVTASRLVRKNGLDILLKAAKHVPVKLVIIGAGKEAAALDALALELGIKQRVLFIGQVPYQMVPRYIAIGDIFVRPSRSEGLGNAFLEAMAVGLPVIATPVGGIPDIIHDGETGLLSQRNNPKDLADKIKLLLADESLRQRLIINGQAMVRQHYDWQLIAQQMRAIFQKV